MYLATSSVVYFCLGFRFTTTPTIKLSIKKQIKTAKLSFSHVYRLKVEGEAVSRDEAPVIICAPHTSFLGSFIFLVPVLFQKLIFMIFVSHRYLCHRRLQRVACCQDWEHWVCYDWSQENILKHNRLVFYILSRLRLRLISLTTPRTPCMSAMQRLCHTIFVDRRSDKSRRLALQNIVKRANSRCNWPKVVF